MSLLLFFRARPGIMRGWESSTEEVSKKTLKLNKRAKRAVNEIKTLAITTANSDLINKDLADFIKFSQQKKTDENKKILAFLLGQLALRILEMYEEEGLMLMELDDD